MTDNLIFPLDYILLTIMILLIIICFWKGFVSSILGLLTWIGAIIITIYFYIDLSNLINSQLIRRIFGINSAIARVCVFLPENWCTDPNSYAKRIDCAQNGFAHFVLAICEISIFGGVAGGAPGLN